MPRNLYFYSNRSIQFLPFFPPSSFTIEQSLRSTAQLPPPSPIEHQRRSWNNPPTNVKEVRIHTEKTVKEDDRDSRNDNDLEGSCTEFSLILGFIASMGRIIYSRMPQNL
ncbi:hypothetical protein F511_37489 [Dorcoceras hygrometricum]|uniref:Uncharacterized protein n=1 Tax=Dorcoceras hygrometricum TaxID=472368 RepID=A0A2Z7B801_9LAMI|nr:hypothetical protein F511_37489 [Dorcoceras hygrometricum]